MIVSCAPLRIRFAGGGSDVAAAVYRHPRGAVLLCTIAKYAFGFLLFYCLKPAQAAVREAPRDLQLDFRLDWGGARIGFAQ